MDAAPARAHIARLRAAGIGVDQIARLAGISPSHVRELVHHSRTGRPTIARVRPETARRVLAITVTTANRAPRSHLAPTGTRRRLQALIAIGWTPSRLAGELGRCTTNLRRTMTSPKVTARTATQVADLYERLWDTRPAHTTAAEEAAIEAARALAARHGWLPPMAWDDIDTDPDPDPDHAAGPAPDLDEIAIERAVAGDGIRLEELTPAEQAEAVRRLRQRGKSLRDIAAQLATTKRTITRRRGSGHAA